MVPYRIVELPSFEIAGKSAWIGGVDDSAAFGRFWEECQANGLMATFETLSGLRPGPRTGGATLGVSRVERDPANRSFYYMIAVECPGGSRPEGLEVYTVPATRWAVFECRGQRPGAIVEAEMFAFGQWLPASGGVHAAAPEMEVYPPGDEAYCEFWLPFTKKGPQNPPRGL